MAKKVLISFLGTGKFADKSKREYSPVNYHLGDKDLGNYSFVGAALKDHFKIDKEKDVIILIGSMHSMWEEIYKTFTPEDEFDEDTHVNIGVFCDDANSQTKLDSFEYKETIEKSLGKKSHIVLIKYGANAEEIQENLKIILGIQNFLDSGDELIVDITHSFRSMPIYIMQLLIFLKNIKDISISHIYYGMFEMTAELKYSPIVDLSSILSVNDWIVGAYNFQQFGNTYKIAELLEKENNEKYKDIIEPLRQFAEVKNLNYISDFKSQIQGLLPLRNKDKMPELGQLVVTPIMKDFLNDFQGINNQEINYSTFQYRMAKWHNEHHNYGYALMLLVEACVTYCCELTDVDYNSFNDRKLVRQALIYQYNPQEEAENNKKEKGQGISEIKRKRIELIKAFSGGVIGDNPEEYYFDSFVLGVDNNRKGEKKNSSKYRGYLDYKNLNNIQEGKAVKSVNRDCYGNGFKNLNTNRNTVAHNKENEKSYKTIISELKESIEFLKQFLDK